MRDGGFTVDLRKQHAPARFLAGDRQVEEHACDLTRELRALRLGLGQKEQQLALAAPQVPGQRAVHQNHPRAARIA